MDTPGTDPEPNVPPAQPDEHVTDSPSSTDPNRDALDTDPAAQPQATIPDHVAEGDRDTVQERYDAEFYCPACGKPLHYQGECTGTPAAPHQPVAVVSTEELHAGDEEGHTAAPSTE